MFSKNEQCIFHMPNSAWIIAKECHHLPLFEELKWRDRPEWFCPRLYRPKDTDFLPEWGVPGCFANPKPKSIRCFRYRWMETHTHTQKKKKNESGNWAATLSELFPSSAEFISGSVWRRDVSAASGHSKQTRRRRTGSIRGSASIRSRRPGMMAGWSWENGETCSNWSNWKSNMRTWNLQTSNVPWMAIQEGCRTSLWCIMLVVHLCWPWVALPRIKYRTNTLTFSCAWSIPHFVAETMALWWNEYPEFTPSCSRTTFLCVSAGTSLAVLFPGAKGGYRGLSQVTQSTKRCLLSKLVCNYTSAWSR